MLTLALQTRLGSAALPWPLLPHTRSALIVVGAHVIGTLLTNVSTLLASASFVNTLKVRRAIRAA